VIVKCDRIPETPNSINIKAQINHVPDPKPKNSTSAKRAQGTKRSLLSKLRYDESSDDDIISTPDVRGFWDLALLVSLVWYGGLQ
jgi:hypothetical protein